MLKVGKEEVVGISLGGLSWTGTTNQKEWSIRTQNRYHPQGAREIGKETDQIVPGKIQPEIVVDYRVDLRDSYAYDTSDV